MAVGPVGRPLGALWSGGDRNPQWGATVVVYTLGVYAFFFGLLLIALGLRLRGLNKRVAERFA